MIAGASTGARDASCWTISISMQRLPERPWPDSPGWSMIEGSDHRTGRCDGRLAAVARRRGSSAAGCVEGAVVSEALTAIPNGEVLLRSAASDDATTKPLPLG